jgi:hypothetical protein
MKYFATLIFAALALGLAGCGTTSEITRAQCEGYSRSPNTAQVEVATPPPAATVIQVAPVAKADQPLPPDTYRVDVVCDLPVSIAAGKYDWVNDDITPKNFPEAGCKPGPAEVTLVDLGAVTTEQANVELDKRGLKPATLPVLLALGAAQPGLQRQNYIVASGSRWSDPDGDVGVPLLCRFGAGRDLSLYWDGHGGGWGAGVRVAAVRK